jgi:hypothetical protein
MRQNPDYFKELCSWNKPPDGPISSEDFRQIIAIEYGKLSGKSGTVASDEAAASARKINTAILSEKRINSQRVALTNLLHTKFPQNVKIDQKTMTLSKNCGFGGNLFCCNNLSKFTNNFVRIVAQFFSENNDNYDMLTLSDLFDEIHIKSNFFELRCLDQQQKRSLRAIIGINIREEQKEQTGGSHSRRKRHASKKSRKSHHRHRRSTRNKKRNTKRHMKRHTKQYRHRK